MTKTTSIDCLEDVTGRKEIARLLLLCGGDCSYEEVFGKIIGCTNCPFQYDDFEHPKNCFRMTFDQIMAECIEILKEEP